MDAISQPLIGRRLNQTSRHIIVAETEVPSCVSISLQEIARLGVVGLREGRVGSGIQPSVREGKMTKS